MYSAVILLSSAALGRGMNNMYSGDDQLEVRVDFKKGFGDAPGLK